MKISTKGRYAFRVMVDIGIYGTEKNVSLKEISERQNISIKYLEQIIKPLCTAKYLDSFKGKYGGYKLSKDPSEYNLKMIIDACEENTLCVPCVRNPKECAKYETCMSISIWQGLQKVIDEYLENISLFDVIKDNSDLNKIANFPNIDCDMCKEE